MSNQTNNTTTEVALEPCGVCKFHWNLTVMPGELHNPNCPHFDDTEKGCACQGCGQRYKVDVQVADDLWNRIRPQGKAEGTGLLCGCCIFSRIEALDEHGELILLPAASAAPTVEERRVDIALGYIVNDARVLAKDVTGPIAGRIALTLYQLCDEIELLDKQIVELTDECGNWRARAEDLAGHALEDDK